MTKSNGLTMLATLLSKTWKALSVKKTSNEAISSRVVIGVGTRVFVNKDGQLIVVLPNQKYEPKDGDIEITKSVFQADINIPVDDFISVTLRTHCTVIQPIEITRSHYFIIAVDPLTKQEKTIKQIEFFDGSKISTDKR